MSCFKFKIVVFAVTSVFIPRISYADVSNEILQLIPSGAVIPSSGGAGTEFGSAVAVFESGTEKFAIVGAKLDEQEGSQAGAAYIFRWNGANWVQQQKLLASDPTSRFFGRSVSGFGDVVVVGSPGDNTLGVGAGAVFVFKRSDNNTPLNPNDDFWAKRAKLIASDGGLYDAFGYSVSISGNTLISGAWREGNPGDPFFINTGEGAAYVFRSFDAGNTWIQEQKLVASDRAAGDSFAKTLSLEGETAVIGAPLKANAASGTGAAYVFRRTGSTWSQVQKLQSSSANTAYIQFGNSVALEGDLLAVGDPFNDDAGGNFGAVTLFRFNGSSWIKETDLYASDAFSNIMFGSSVAVAENTVVVGAFAGGRTHIFRKTGSTWTQRVSLHEGVACPGNANDRGELVGAAGTMLTFGYNCGSDKAYVLPVTAADIPLYLITVDQSNHAWPPPFGGSILPGTTFASHGSIKTFTVSTVAGYYLSNLIIDDQPLGNVSSYTFSNITSNHTVNGAFGKVSDTTPPTVNAPSILPNNNPSTGVVTIGSSASDNVGVLKVEFYIGTSSNPYVSLIGTDYGYPFSLVWDTTTAANGTHNITAKAYDTAPIPQTAVASRSVSVQNALRISGSVPPNGFIDALEDRDPSTGAFLGKSEIAITFSAAATGNNGGALSTSDFDINCLKNSSQVSDLQIGTRPTITQVTLTNPSTNTYHVRLSQRICLGAWTELKATRAKALNGSPISANGNRIVLGNLPMDVTQDGRVLGDDINRWLAIRNGGFTLPPTLTPLMLIDQRRNGVLAGEDITRAIQLLLGIGTFQPWSSFELGPMP